MNSNHVAQNRRTSFCTLITAFAQALLFSLIILSFARNAQAAPAINVGSATFESGMTYFNKGNYKGASQIFKHIIEMNPDNTSSAYMYGLSLQRLGEKEQAITVYKNIIQTDAESAAAFRSQSALDLLDPAFMSAWRRAHPVILEEHPKGRVSSIRGQFLPEHDVWSYDSDNGHIVVDATINDFTLPVEINLKSEKSYFGADQLQKHPDPSKNNVFITSCEVGSIQRQPFWWELQRHTDRRPILGANFFVGYDVKIDPKKQTIALIKLAPEMSLNGGLRHKGQPVESFEVPFRNVYYETPTYNDTYGETRQDSNNRVNKDIVIDVTVDHSRVSMIYGRSSDFQFSLEQINQVDPHYASDLGAGHDEGGSFVTSGRVLLNSVRLGNLTRENVPAQITERTDIRSHTAHWSDADHPLFGSAFCSGWDVIVDEKRMILKFSRQGR